MDSDIATLNLVEGFVFLFAIVFIDGLEKGAVDVELLLDEAVEPVTLNYFGIENLKDLKVFVAYQMVADVLLSHQSEQDYQFHHSIVTLLSLANEY